MNAKVTTQAILGTLVGLSISLAILPLTLTTAASGAVQPVAVSDNSGALERVLLHYTERDGGRVERTYADILGNLDPSVEVVVAVESLSELMDLEARLHRLGVDRVLTPLETGRRITTWSRDRYTLAAVETTEGPHWLLTAPDQADATVEARLNDWMVPFDVANAYEDVDVALLPLRFDGGDIMTTDRYVFASHRLIQKNVGRQVPSREALIDLLEFAFGREVILFGEHSTDVPWHHLGMYMTPLADGRIAVGDPDLALTLISEDEAQALGADFSEEMVERFRYVADALEAAGFSLVRLPLIPLDERTYVTYNNVLMDARPAGATVFVPTYGLPALDDFALARFAEWGYEVVPVDVTDVYLQHGSVRCLVNVISRAL